MVVIMWITAKQLALCSRGASDIMSRKRNIKLVRQRLITAKSSSVLVAEFLLFADDSPEKKKKLSAPSYRALPSSARQTIERDYWNLRWLDALISDVYQPSGRKRKIDISFVITPLIASFGIKGINWYQEWFSFLNNQLVYTMSDNRKDQWTDQSSLTSNRDFLQSSARTALIADL